MNESAADSCKKTKTKTKMFMMMCVVNPVFFLYFKQCTNECDCCLNDMFSEFIKQLFIMNFSFIYLIYLFISRFKDIFMDNLYAFQLQLSVIMMQLCAKCFDTYGSAMDPSIPIPKQVECQNFIPFICSGKLVEIYTFLYE